MYLACNQSEIPEVTQVRRPQGCMRRGGVRDSILPTSVIEREGELEYLGIWGDIQVLGLGHASA